MEILFEEQNDTLMILLRGELDHHNSIAGRERLTLKLSQKNYRRIIFHLEGLTFMDSSGIAVVIRAKRRVEALQGNLAVINIPRQAARVLETAGLGRYIDLA